MSLTPAQVQLRRKWVEALRSGQYKQARGQLHRTMPSGQRKFCCLGVAEDVLDSSRWIGDGICRRDTCSGIVFLESWTLTPESTNALGLQQTDVTEFESLNDKDKLNFDAIAMAVDFLTLADAEAL